jgi:hypothetical protein
MNTLASAQLDRGDMQRHLIIPAVESPNALGRTPLLGAEPEERAILLFFRGDFRGPESPHYSRGIRQKLRRLAADGAWGQKYNISIGTREDVPGPYDVLLMRSTFCLVAPGSIPWHGTFLDLQSPFCLLEPEWSPVMPDKLICP